MYQNYQLGFFLQGGVCFGVLHEMLLSLGLAILQYSDS